MANDSISAPAARPSLLLHLIWLISLLGSLALSIAGFWVLLIHRYSPMNYLSQPIVADTVEFVWFGLSLCVAVLTFVLLWRNIDGCRQFVNAMLPVAAVAALVLLKSLVGMPTQCYEPILFSAAVGWSCFTGLKRLSGRFMGGADSAPDCFLGIPVGHCWLAMLWCVGLSLGAYYFWQQVRYLNALALGYQDCGECARVLHNTLHNPRELFMRVNPDLPLFYDHFQPVVLLFVPFWALWPDMKLLILFQVVSVIAVAWPLYWMGKRAFGDDTAAALLSLAWLAYPSTSQFIYRASNGFHWTSFCMLLYFVALACWVQRRYAWAVAAAVAALLLKEEVAIMIGMFGVYLAIFERRRRIGLICAAGGFGYFLLITAVVIPAFNHGLYPGMRYYSELGDSVGAILFSPLTKPEVFWAKIFRPSTFYFLAVLLAPLLFLPLRKPSILVIASVPFVFMCLAKAPGVTNICYQHQANLLPVLFLGLVLALRDTSMQPVVTYRRAALAGVLMASLTLSIFLGNTFWSKDTLPVITSPGRLPLVHKFAALINPDSTLVATKDVAAQFVKLKYLYLFPQFPPHTDYVLLDLRERRWPTDPLEPLRRVSTFQRQLESNSDLHLVAADDGLVLYSRLGTQLDARATVELSLLPDNATRFEQPLERGIMVAGFLATNLAPERKGKTQRVRIKVFFTPTQPLDVDLAAQCIIRIGLGTPNVESYISDLIPLGQGIWPTSRWRPGRFYGDDFVVTIPSEQLGQRFSVSFDVQTLADLTNAR